MIGPNHGYQLRPDGEGEYSDEDGEEDDEDDTDSILGAFDHIGDVITRTGSVSGLTGSHNLLPSGGNATANSSERTNYHHNTTANNLSVGTKSVDGSAACVNPLGGSGSGNGNQHHSLIPPSHGALVGTVHNSGPNPIPTMISPLPLSNLTLM